MEQQKQTAYTLSTVIMTLVIGLAGGYLIGVQSNFSFKKVSPENAVAERSENGEAAFVHAVFVQEQIAGNIVVIEKVILEETGWVAIHEDEGGKPGKVLGAQLFDAGAWGGEVILLRATVPGKIYYAIVHRDNGDRTFDLKLDVPLSASNGLVMSQFKTSEDILPLRNEFSQ